MAKMRKFLFWNESGDEKEKEALVRSKVNDRFEWFSFKCWHNNM